MVEPIHKLKSYPAPLTERVPAGGTVFEIQPEISSMQAELAMLTLEPLLGFRIPKTTRLRGEYNDREEFVQDVTSWLKAEYAKRSGANTNHR